MSSDKFTQGPIGTEQKTPQGDATAQRKVAVLRQKDRLFKFDKERIVLGSVVSADLRLTGDGVSPIHAVIELRLDPATGQSAATLFDLASDTGVFVNGKKIVTCTLAAQDQITLGKHQL